MAGRRVLAVAVLAVLGALPAARADQLVQIAVNYGGTGTGTFQARKGVTYYYGTTTGATIMAVKKATSDGPVNCERSWFLNGEMPPVVTTTSGYCFAYHRDVFPEADWTSERSVQLGQLVGLMFIVSLVGYGLGRQL